MTIEFLKTVDSNFKPEINENVVESLFEQYEKVITESIITSFGLDFIFQDQHGGDVDTIHNVRQIDKDSEMYYKNSNNQNDYGNHGKYDKKESSKYHQDKSYREKNKEVSLAKKEGTLIDSYTEKKIPRNAKSDLDHVISAKEIHEDRGRILSELSGIDLANNDENLKPTNPHTNRSHKKALTMEECLEKHGDKYTESQKKNMREIDKKARAVYEQKILKAYYTSRKFAKDTAKEAGKSGIKMGLRQALGFVFAEVWFAIKFELQNSTKNFGEYLLAIGNGIKKGFDNAKIRYKELLVKFQDGAVAGILSSLTTTLCNVFFTTAKNVVKIIRQSYASIVQAGKILIFNPDNLFFGERMRAVLKIIATGASVVIGGAVAELISNTGFGLIPILGEVVSAFCGAFVSGVMSCSLLYFFDRSVIMNKVFKVFNEFEAYNNEINYLKTQSEEFQKYAAQLLKIDIDKFTEESNLYHNLTKELNNFDNSEQLNLILNNIIKKSGIKLPWQGDFNEFMNNKNHTLNFN